MFLLSLVERLEGALAQGCHDLGAWGQEAERVRILTKNQAQWPRERSVLVESRQAQHEVSQGPRTVRSH